MPVLTRTLKSSVFSIRQVLYLLMPLLLFTGCRNHDVLEAQLRTRDNDLRELRDELDRMEGYNHALQGELGAVRSSPSAKITPEEAGQLYTLKSIQLGRLTGGLNDDNDPGDEALQVLVEPHDIDGHTIKAPGSLTIIALEVTPEGLKKPLSTWHISPGELRRKWRSGLLTTGYYLVLPWKIYPSFEKMRIVAQFALSDGRVFEADKDVTIHLVPEKYRKKNVPQSAPGDPTCPPDPETPLFAPRKYPDGPDDLGGDPMSRNEEPGSSLIRAVRLLKPVPRK